MPSKDTTNKIVAVLTFVVVVGSVASYSLLSRPAATVPAPMVTNSIASFVATAVATPSAVVSSTPDVLITLPTNIAVSGSPVVTASPSLPTNMVSTPAQAHVYKDGSYNVEGDYMSPGGAEHIGVTVTIKDDVVVDSAVTAEATLPISKRFQMDFANGYKQFVTGKKLSDINLSEVSGASLTSQGFNDALAKIKARAQA